MSIIGRPKTIRGNMDPDPKWKLRGDIVHGKPVYIEVLPNVQKRVKIGPDGKEVWHKHPTTAEAIKPVYELFIPGDQKVVARAFIQDDLGNGMVLKNYDFEPSQADIDRERYSQSPMTTAALQRVVEEQQERIDKLLSFIEGRIPSIEAEINQADDPDAADIRVPTLDDMVPDEEVVEF